MTAILQHGRISAFAGQLAEDDRENYRGARQEQRTRAEPLQKQAARTAAAMLFAGGPFMELSSVA